MANARDHCYNFLYLLLSFPTDERCILRKSISLGYTEYSEFVYQLDACEETDPYRITEYSCYSCDTTMPFTDVRNVSCKISLQLASSD